MSAPQIVVAGILDTKGAEIKYLAQCVARAGGEARIMELSVGREVGWADYPLSGILQADGIAIDEFYRKDRAGRAKVLAKAAADFLAGLQRSGACDGVIAYGGSMGATIATAAMRALPLGVPKMMLSTINGQMRAYAGTKDICMMYSVSEAGLNRVTRKILTNAAYGIVGMAQAVSGGEEDKPLVGCMMFGVTTPCVSVASDYMQMHGYDVIVNHATGSGGRSFEEMIDDGLLCGVLDITTHEVVSDIFGNRDTAGPRRLRSAAENGVPQVVAPGGVDFLLFEDDEPVPQEVLQGVGIRGKYVHNPSVVNYGLTLEETEKVARSFAERLSPATAPTVLCIPLRGWCANDHPAHDGQPHGLLWMGLPEDPRRSARSAAFAKTLAQTLPDKENLEVLLIDRHINDRDFAQIMAELLHEMLQGTWKKGSHTGLPYVSSLCAEHPWFNK